MQRDKDQASDRPSHNEVSGVPSSMLRGVPERTRIWIEAMLTEHEAMRRAISCLEDKNRRLLSLFREAEQRRLAVTSQYVVLAGLLGAREPAETISVIQDVLINLIGCEQATIFEVDAERRHLVLLSSMGIDAEQYRTIPIGVGVIGTAALTGTLYIAGEGEISEITACVPLRIDSEVRGAIVLFQLLSHKAGLTSDDRTLLSLLATYAAIALQATSALGGADARRRRAMVDGERAQDG
jgi:hypothetical protein